MKSFQSISSCVKLNNGTMMPCFAFGTYLIKKVDPIVYALNKGLRLLDTAMFYGNEDILLDSIRQSEVERKDVFITTKLWYTDHGYEECKSAFEKSMSTLGLDYVDLYLVHWPGTNSKKNKETRKQTWKAMEEIYESGRAKAIGVSNYTIDHLKEMFSYCKIRPAVNQCEMHLELQQNKLREFCKKEEVVFQSYSPLAKGGLLKKEVVLEIAKKHEMSPAQVCLNWIAWKDTCFAVKTSSQKHIDEICDIFKFSLDEEDIKKLDAMDRDYHCTWDPTDVD